MLTEDTHGWIYASALAYIVDAYPGRSSEAVATNSCFRGISAFVFIEAAVPLRDSIGDGGLSSLWAELSRPLRTPTLARASPWRSLEGECRRTRKGPEFLFSQ